jgi:hypothetical protein
MLRAAAPCVVSTDEEDVVAVVRDWADAGNLQTAGAVLPRLADVSFDGEARLAELVERFASDPAARGAIASEQRAAVVGRMSYTAGMARVQRRIAALLRETADQDREGTKQCA